MWIQSQRYGAIEAEAEDVLRFPRGPVGRSDLRRFVLAPFGPGIPLRWLQSVDDAAWGLPLGKPTLFRTEGRLLLPPAERRAWGLARPERSALWIVCTIGPTGSWLLGNLLAPLLVDVEAGAGCQVVREGPLSELRVPVDLVAFAEARRALGASGIPQPI